MIELNQTNFNDFVYRDNPAVLVFAHAGWCGSCQVMRSVLAEFLQESARDLPVGELDVEKNEKLAHRIDVETLPTIIFYREGEEVDRFYGAKGKDILAELISKE